jgi:hypothetical protein
MWQKKYVKAIKEGKQLIGDKVLRESAIEWLGDMQVLQEVRFKGFTADLLGINTKYKGVIGLEIKSDRDTLEKLETQLLGYSKYCHFVCVFTTLSRMSEIQYMLADERFAHVGIFYYFMSDDGNHFKCKRKPEWNDVGDVGTKWITKKHQLYQWKYLLEEIWEE